MTENTQTTEKTTEAPVVTTGAPESRGPRSRGGARGGARGRNARNRRPRERVKSEFDQKIVSIRRVTRVVAGGRRFSFSVSLVAGDKKGRVGVGIGKAGDTSLAIDKAVKDAKKNMITVARTKNNSIRHDVEAKYSSSIVAIRPSQGRGLVAGGAVRTVLEYAGITDVTSKILTRSKNHLNNARAALKALSTLR